MTTLLTEWPENLVEFPAVNFDFARSAEPQRFALVPSTSSKTVGGKKLAGNMKKSKKAHPLSLKLAGKKIAKSMKQKKTTCNGTKPDGGTQEGKKAKPKEIEPALEKFTRYSNGAKLIRQEMGKIRVLHDTTFQAKNKLFDEHDRCIVSNTMGLVLTWQEMLDRAPLYFSNQYASFKGLSYSEKVATQFKDWLY